MTIDGIKVSKMEDIKSVWVVLTEKEFFFSYSGYLGRERVGKQEVTLTHRLAENYI